MLGLPATGSGDWESRLCSSATRPRKAPSITATMPKQHCRMLQVERFFRQFECCFEWTKSMMPTMLPAASTLLLVWTGLKSFAKRLHSKGVYASSVESTILRYTVLIGRKHARDHANWAVIGRQRRDWHVRATHVTWALHLSDKSTYLTSRYQAACTAVRPGTITRSAARRRRIGAGAVSA